MRAKHTTENAGGASIGEKIIEVRGIADDLQYELYRLNCLATITENKTSEALFSKGSEGDRPGYYYVGDEDHKIIGFVTSEVSHLSTKAEDMVDDLVKNLLSVQHMLQQHQPPSSEPTRSAALEEVIASWEKSYAELILTERDGGIPADTPESEAEKIALNTLVGTPCVTLSDVRRKANLFLSNEYLRNSASDFTDQILRSYASATIT